MYSSQLMRRSPTEIGLMALVFSFMLLIVYTLLPEAPPDIVTNYCPQVPALRPSQYLESELFDEPPQTPALLGSKQHLLSSRMFYEPEYVKHSVRVLQGALRLPTMSYDDMNEDPVLEPRFGIFKKQHEYLFRTFPLTSKHAEVVNTYGLLYTIPGSDESLKPVMLMAHQDVVPVPEETLDQWDHEPFEAFYDGEWLYGRGAADTKDSLIGILESVEALISQGWQPKRTVLISFGFDEEIGGFRGALPLAQEIERRYGADGVELVVDEGFGMPLVHGALVGAVAVGEKGYLDILVTLETPGGHSSVPPDHTGIGIMSEVVKRLESHPFPAELEDSNPTLGFYRCLAEHAPHMNKEMRRWPLDIDHEDHRQHLTDYVSSIPSQKYWIRTSQAVDVVAGGVKLNALPEQVELRVNHRINLNSGSAALIDRFEEIVSSVARDFGLGVSSQGESLLDRTLAGSFNITAVRTLEPAPVSPHWGSQWDLVAGTTRSVVDGAPFETEPLVMAPAVFAANTDTRHVWGLTRAIYRFKPGLAADMVNYHTVNERLRFRSHSMTVAWYYEFILNATS